MTHVNRRASHLREARVRRSFDGLVASYIRELADARVQSTLLARRRGDLAREREQ
jgi:hypothetical protein